MNKIDQKQALSYRDEVSLKELVLKIQEWYRFILSKWLVILIAGAVGGTIGITYALTQKPTYQAQLTFALQNERSGGGLSALNLASQFGIDLGGSSGGDSFSGDNLLVLIKSRSMIEKALLATTVINNENITFAEFYIRINKLDEKWKAKPESKINFLPGLDRSKFTFKQDSLMGIMCKNLTNNNVFIDKVDKKLSLLSLEVDSQNEIFSKNFTEVLAKVVSDFYVQTKTKKEMQNVSILKRQADSVRRILNASISGVAVATDENPNPNPTLQILKVPSQRKTVDIQVNTAILSELVKNLEVAKMSLLQETPLIQIIDRPILPLEKKGFGKLRGLILMSVIASFSAVIILTISLIYKKIMQSE